MAEIERCTSCVLPRCSSFVFDDKGVCNLCNAAKRAASAAPAQSAAIKPAEELERLLADIRERGKGQKYDCLVGVSGGRDSSYLLYLLARKHGLRCLAAYYRTPFTSDTTDQNVKKLTTRLNVPLVEMNISQERHRQIAREFVLLWTKKPLPTIVNMACAECKLVNREIYTIAKKHGVKSIVFGANKFEEVQIAAGVASDEVITEERAAKYLGVGAQLRQMMMLMKKGFGILGSSAAVWKYIPLGFKASVMYITPHTPYLRFRRRGISILEYFFYADWDQADCEKALQEMGWELPPGCVTSWKSDCSFAELKNCMFGKMSGVTYMDAFVANMVRSGAITREEGLERLAKEGRVSMERVEDACRVLDLPTDLFV